MDYKLLNRLKTWRASQAQKEGVELFRVLSSSTLEAIAGAVPQNKEEFLNIKGFKEGKWKRYGATLIRLVSDAAEGSDTPLASSPQMRGGVESSRRRGDDTRSEIETAEILHTPHPDQNQGAPLIQGEQDIVGENLYTVSSFLNLLNDSFAGLQVRIKGEVSSVDVRERVVYFSLKDQADESVLSCLIFRYHYELSGVKLAVGQEVIVEGVPQIWKPTGRLSLKVEVIEVAGEGALKKAYDELKRKLESEGLFAPERKRILPEFPEHIALITSNQGAAIGDFTMNLGHFGFKISFYNSSVEGKRAVLELIQAVKYFNRHSEKYDVLVIIRGGGSLESLQAFNNEALTRVIAGSKIPVLAGIGHEKDVSLAALVADVMVSTPTATARTLREPWEQALFRLEQLERGLLFSFEATLDAARQDIQSIATSLVQYLQQFRERFVLVRHKLFQYFERLRFTLREKQEHISQQSRFILRQYGFQLETAGKRLENIAAALARHNPERLLKLGYSLVYKDEKVIRSADTVTAGDVLDIQLGKGKIESEVRRVK